MRRLIAYLLVLLFAAPTFGAGRHGITTNINTFPTATSSVLNLSGASNNQGLMFVNVLQGVGGNAAFATGAGYTTDGYPTTVQAVSVDLGSVFLPTLYSGSWTYHHDNTGCIILIYPQNMTATASSGTVTGSGGKTITIIGTDAEVTIQPVSTVPTSVQVKWAGASSSCPSYSGMTNAYLVPSALKSSYLAGSYFTPLYTTSISGTGSGVLRFLDLASINNSNWANYTNRRQLSAFSWAPAATVYDANLIGGAISGTDTYTIGPAPSTPGTYVNGETIQGYFAHTNTVTTPTLNVNGKGPKTITKQSGAPLSVGAIPVGYIDTFVYDAAQDVFLSTNAAATGGSNFAGGVTLGIPFEAQIALCNQLNKDCWLQIPNLWSTADAISLATLAASNLARGLKLHVEYSNEFSWNTNFTQSSWGNLEGAALGFATGTGQSLYGLKICQMFPAMRAAWTGAGRSASDFIGILAFQAFGNASTSGGTSIPTYRMNGNELSGYGCSTAPNRPVDNVDALSYANYIEGVVLNGGLNGQVGLYNATGTYTGMTAAANAFPTSPSTAFAWMDTDIRTGGGVTPATGQVVLTLQAYASTANIGKGAIGVYPSWEAVAASYDSQRAGIGLAPLFYELYEGGYESVPPLQSGGTTQCTAMGISTSYCSVGTQFNNITVSGTVQDMFTGYKNSATFAQLVQDQFNQFMAQPHSRRPGWYVYGPNISAWSLYPGSNESTPFQSYNGIAAYNATAH